MAYNTIIYSITVILSINFWKRSVGIHRHMYMCIPRTSNCYAHKHIMYVNAELKRYAKLNKLINEHDSTDGLACIMHGQPKATHTYITGFPIIIVTTVATYMDMYFNQEGKENIGLCTCTSIKKAMHMDFMFTGR